MILGVDHLALSSGELSKDLSRVVQAGYKAKFIHEDLPNHPSKKPFLTLYRPSHRVAYCQAPRGIALELIEHGAPLEETASLYQVFLDGVPAQNAPYENPLPCDWGVWKEAGFDAVRCAVWQPFRAPFWHALGSAGGPATVGAVLFPASDLERSLRFWTKGLRAREIKRGGGAGRRWIHLAWRTPVARWSLEMILCEGGKAPGTPALDRAGFSCLALLSSDLERDRAALLEAGAEKAAEISDHRVNGKKLKILFAQGPSGELVELIEVCS